MVTPLPAGDIGQTRKWADMYNIWPALDQPGINLTVDQHWANQTADQHWINIWTTHEPTNWSTLGHPVREPLLGQLLFRQWGQHGTSYHK